MPAPPPTNRDKLIGARVKLQRLELELSQVQLAQKVGVAWQSVQNWETGKTGISSKRLSQLSEALRVPPSFFLGETAPKEVDEVTLYCATQEGLAFIEQLRRIKSTKIKRRVLAMLTEIAAELES